jgi:membrane protein DedA with SNARE-associated domain
MAIDFAPLVANYGYPAALVGAVFEGETVLVLAGLFAHRGVLHLPLLIALARLAARSATSFISRLAASADRPFSKNFRSSRRRQSACMS